MDCETRSISLAHPWDIPDGLRRHREHDTVQKRQMVKPREKEEPQRRSTRAKLDRQLPPDECCFEQPRKSSSTSSTGPKQNAALHQQIEP